MLKIERAGEKLLTEVVKYEATRHMFYGATRDSASV